MRRLAVLVLTIPVSCRLLVCRVVLWIIPQVSLLLSFLNGVIIPLGLVSPSLVHWLYTSQCILLFRWQPTCLRTTRSLMMPSSLSVMLHVTGMTPVTLRLSQPTISLLLVRLRAQTTGSLAESVMRTAILQSLSSISLIRVASMTALSMPMQKMLIMRPILRPIPSQRRW